MEITVLPRFPTEVYLSTRSLSVLQRGRITQAEGRDGTFQSQIGTRIKSVCPMLDRVARRWMSCSLESFGEGALKCK